MKNNSRLIYFLITVLLFQGFFQSSCKNRNERLPRSKQAKESGQLAPRISNSLKKVTFYLENSESIFGYVSGFTEYVDVVSELAEKPEFIEEKTLRDFYLINGKELKITPIGQNPNIFKQKLNKQGFRCGDITKSNLNDMFQTALNNAGGDSISILISDAIYDIGQPDAPFNALSTEGKETRSKFIQRLDLGNIQTIIIKLNSKFNGDYFYSSKKGKISINQNRPFYVFIFGESQLLNKYFTEEYISKKLKGFESMARFLKIDFSEIPYQATSQNIKGNFSFDKKNKNLLIKSKKDRFGKEFQFAIATDFSSLPFPDSYLNVKENYASNMNYSIVEISKPTKRIYEVNSFNTTHLITVNTSNSPYGSLEVSLKYNVPNWISETNIDNENNIANNTTNTFGFKFLTDAISEAYEYKNKQQNIVTFKFEILK